ncbi:acetyl esterase/lipase [Sphingomonas naasensis]|nr:alpha/beta hydrolase [Sphingomonas naasensis]NIJ20287.1 acetyl esterase/lipase [Sphingomonas naasensis]
MVTVDAARLSRRGVLAGGAAAATLPAAARAAPAAELDIPLWPDDILAERVRPPMPIDPKLPARYHPVVNVTRPVITPYRPARPNGAGIITCAGGGYVLVGRSPGPPNWLADRGYWVFDLLYRLPGGGWRAGPDASLQDVQQAIRLVRARAAAFGVDPARIGVAGFSAGGHIAASAATRFADDLQPPSNALASVSARPDFALLACPVITMTEPHRHGASTKALFGAMPSADQAASHSAELRVTPRTPPCFLAHSASDRVVSPQNSILMFSALRAVGVAAELHIFDGGGHDMGQGFKPGTPVSAWPELFIQWLARSGFAAPGANARG